MKVVIPVAGEGTRLRPHTYSMPKPLLQVGGKEILAHLLDPVLELNPEEIIFVIGYRGEQVRQYVTAHYDFNATFIQQDQLLGLGYAINLAVQHIEGGDLLVLLGDTIVETDLRQFIRAGDNVLGVLPVDDPERFGVVTVEDGRVTKLVEKPTNPDSNLAIIGLYYFNDVAPLKTALGAHLESGQRTRGEVQLTDALQLLMEQGTNFVPYQVAEWFDCGKKETMLSSNRHLVTTKGNHPDLPGCRIIPPVYIHPSAQIENSQIGPHVSVSEGSIICNSEISNSIISRQSRIENCVLTDSLIGNQVSLSGGRVVANLGDSSELKLD